MRSILFAFAAALCAASPLSAMAGYQGSISFTPEEIARHQEESSAIAQSAAACLDRDYQHFVTFFRRYGVSPYYGDRGSFGKLSYQAKKDYLRSIGKNPKLVAQMQPLSCVELMLNCLGEGFRANNEADLWQRIRTFTVANSVDGMATQYALELLGWKTLYWNPDTRLNRDWDADERAKNPTNSDRFWGYHQEYWVNVQRHSRYVFNHVDDARRLVNFGDQPPAFLQDVPFFVGIAHGGYHVFPGSFGRVVEAHSTKQITDPNNLESSAFNPLAGEGPTDGLYHSGVITVPPGYLNR